MAGIKRSARYALATVKALLTLLEEIKGDLGFGEMQVLTKTGLVGVLHAGGTSQFPPTSKRRLDAWLPKELHARARGLRVGPVGATEASLQVRNIGDLRINARSNARSSLIKGTEDNQISETRQTLSIAGLVCRSTW